MDIGWVGLGGIGTEMVKRLLGAGHRVTVYARGKGLAQAQAAGAAASSDYAALAAASELFVLCVYKDEQQREVLFDKGALAALRPGAILATHTTGSPAMALEMGERAPEGVAVLDATFSGGPADVAAGRLTLMVGGEAAALERARPAFETYAQQIHHAGALGQGQTLKLLNNLLFAANLMNAAELMTLAKGQGLVTQTVAQVVQACSGQSYAMNMFKAERPLEVALAAARPYLEKDVAAAVEAAAEAGLDIAAFAPVIDYYRPR